MTLVINDPRTFRVSMETLQSLANLEDDLRLALTGLRSFRKAVECVSRLNQSLKARVLMNPSASLEIENWLDIYQDKATTYIETVEDLLERINSMNSLVTITPLLYLKLIMLALQ